MSGLCTLARIRPAWVRTSSFGRRPPLARLSGITVRAAKNVPGNGDNYGGNIYSNSVCCQSERARPAFSGLFPYRFCKSDIAARHCPAHRCLDRLAFRCSRCSWSQWALIRHSGVPFSVIRGVTRSPFPSGASPVAAAAIISPAGAATALACNRKRLRRNFIYSRNTPRNTKAKMLPAKTNAVKATQVQ